MMGSESKHTHLLPCPFCSGEAKSTHRINSNAVTCQGCGATVKQSEMGQGDADEIWNTRANQAEIAALRLKLKNTADALEYCWRGMADDPLEPKVKKTLEAALLALTPSNPTTGGEE